VLSAMPGSKGKTIEFTPSMPRIGTAAVSGSPSGSAGGTVNSSEALAACTAGSAARAWASVRASWSVPGASASTIA